MIRVCKFNRRDNDLRIQGRPYLKHATCIHESDYDIVFVGHADRGCRYLNTGCRPRAALTISKLFLYVSISLLDIFYMMNFRFESFKRTSRR